eukprot:356312-Chlamydomonas_euryale.AAC.5
MDLLAETVGAVRVLGGRKTEDPRCGLEACCSDVAQMWQARGITLHHPQYICKTTGLSELAPAVIHVGAALLA